MGGLLGKGRYGNGYDGRLAGASKGAKGVSVGGGISWAYRYCDSPKAFLRSLVFSGLRNLGLGN